MNQRALLCIFGIMGCLVSCTNDRDLSVAPTKTEPTPVFFREVNSTSYGFPGTPFYVSPLDSVIVVAVWEEVFSGDQLPETWVGICVGQYTDRTYSNFNLYIQQDVEVGPGSIVFVHHGIYAPGWLQPAFGPARTRTYLGAPIGEYALEFRYLGQTDEYRMTVTDSTIELLPIDTSHTRRYRSLYWRAHPNSPGVSAYRPK